MDSAANQKALLAVKILHTVVWAVLAACILAIPAMTRLGEYGHAAGLTGIVLLEVLVLLLNRGSCPLTPLAARYTQDRKANFDIFLPEWLASHNKQLFGALYVFGVGYLITRWLVQRP